ncbi:hypothetical protein SAMN05444920_118101 [Nonomuraea solani]|uniref:Uncharacterized protein n=1 Tax=Nonomuraea solani TaxID=1144553 RepID=A0A1H6ESX5_9ACTN|nr:hypothetical protein [Nonomuraea solani]SEH00912.1 hypothetical protein SAMN05444920_118101 [Nonomuraea solani]
MKVRKLSAAALLTTALGATILAGAAPASASASDQAGATSAPAERYALSPLPPDWYWSLRYETMDACRVGFQDAAENGQYTGLATCRWYEGDRHRQAGYYFLIYIP